MNKMNEFSTIVISAAGSAFAIWFVVFLWRFMGFLQRQIEDVHKKCNLCKLETQELKEKLYLREEEIKSLNKKQRQLRKEVRKTGD